jgi:uncharacterized protein (TIGR03437 family)
MELIPATPWISDGFYAGSGNRAGPAPSVQATPGTLIELQGYGLTVNGTLRRVFLGDIAVPVSPNQRYQVPWEIAPGNYPVRFESNSPFEQDASVSVTEVMRTFLWDPMNVVTNFLFHSSTMAPVTPQNPAAPGEIIVGYMAGLGPTTPRVETGQATPNVLARVASGFECRLDGSVQGPIDVMYAGLAPGMIGIYQVNLRVPPLSGIPRVRIVCGWPDGRGYGYALLDVRMTAP